MPLPKRRHSKQRSRKRRTHWKLEAPTLVDCPHCHKPKLPHRVCPSCGWYDGQEVMSVGKKKEDEKKK
jgi:large subunit ribosomal protein L32